MQQFLSARNLHTIPENEIKLNLQPLETLIMKAPFKKKTVLQEYAFLNLPITTIFNGLIVVHVLTNAAQDQQILLLVSIEPHFIISKPDLTQVMQRATSIARTIAIVRCLSTQSASLRAIFLKTMHVGEILSMDEILISKCLAPDVPRYHVLTKEEEKLFFKQKCTSRDKISKLSYLEDGIGRYLGFLPGTVVCNLDKNLHRLVID